MTPVLRELRLEDEAQFLAAHHIMAAEDFVFALDYDPVLSFSAYLTKLENNRKGKGIPAGWVASSFLVAEVQGVIVGRLSLRHDLSEFLRRVGGHIGFGVLPEYRGRGYAVSMLKEGLRRATELGLTRVMLACDEPNLGSRRVIEQCGGVYEDSYEGSEAPLPVRRYWLRTSG